MNDHPKEPRPSVTDNTVPRPVIPVLDYNTARSVKRTDRRAKSVGIGIVAVWLSLGLAVGAAYLSSDAKAFVPTLGLAGAGCVVVAAVDASKRKHMGLLVGLVVGVLTVMGVGALTIAVVCGAFK